ncbi:DUF1643 domain-containing protein [Vagococcus fluvialis]|uniref:DUF1643 domain-containing protein n=1 Tax=Vagococcus fluvialis TaxID=2738 RepID=UPI0037DC2F12
MFDNDNHDTVIFILINPSRANQSVSDITVNRTLKYAEDKSFRKVIILTIL